MSDIFLNNLMRASYTITKAARCLALNEAMEVQTHLGVDETLLADEAFLNVVRSAIRQAQESKKAVLTNNLITDITDAPHTNTHLSGLRIIIAYPVHGYGAIYLDQSVRDGVFERDTIEKITALVDHLLIESKLDLEEEAIAELYGTV